MHTDNYSNTVTIPSFCVDRFSEFMVQELRSNHAGETGAVYIYKGILAVTGDDEVRQFAQSHLDIESIHLDFFDQWLPSHHHSMLIHLWRLAGFTLGAISALFGKRALYTTITSVESFVVYHYQQQLDYINQHGTRHEKLLAPILRQFQFEEGYHRLDAMKRLDNRPNSLLGRLWYKLVDVGSSFAVSVAKRV